MFSYTQLRKRYFCTWRENIYWLHQILCNFNNKNFMGEKKLSGKLYYLVFKCNNFFFILTHFLIFFTLYQYQSLGLLHYLQDNTYLMSRVIFQFTIQYMIDITIEQSSPIPKIKKFLDYSNKKKVCHSANKNNVFL